MKDYSNKNLNEELENQLDDNNQPTNPVNAFMQRNGKKITLIAISVILLIGLLFLYNSNKQKNEDEALITLARIELYYQVGEFENALFAPDELPTVRGEKVVGLVHIVSKYGNTKAGQRATLLAADAYYQLGNFNEAKLYYEKATKSNNNEIKIGGYAGTASCIEKDGKLKEAADLYQKAANLVLDETLKLRYLFFSGLCNEKSGNNELAKKIYRDIITLNKFGEFHNMAKAGIVRLGEDIE